MLKMLFYYCILQKLIIILCKIYFSYHVRETESDTTQEEFFIVFLDHSLENCEKCRDKTLYTMQTFLWDLIMLETLESLIIHWRVSDNRGTKYSYSSLAKCKFKYHCYIQKILVDIETSSHFRCRHKCKSCVPT